MPRPSKYTTEEERKEAKRESARRYYQNHKEQQRAHIRKYQLEHGHNRSALGYEVLSAEDNAALSHAPTSMTERVLADMNVDYTAEYMDKFKQMLLDADELTDDVLESAFTLARSSTSANSKRGAAFEQSLRRNILYELRLKPQKYYVQVSVDNGATRIDSVISNQVCDDKTKLDLSQAVIVSYKTSLSTQWREDMHLYPHCKAYVMVTLDDKYPQWDLPDNVYLCSPHYKCGTAGTCTKYGATGTSGNIINLNDLIPTVMKYLDPLPA